MSLSRNLASPRAAFSELQRSFADWLRPYVEPGNATINICLAFIYFFVGRFGLRPNAPNHSITAIWLPAGISLAAFLLRGNRVWPGIYLGALVLSTTLTGSFAISSVMGIGTSLEGLVGAYFVNRFAKGINAFFKTGDALRFIFFAGALAPAMCATFGVGVLCLSGLARFADFSTLWFVWWLGDLLGVLFLTPFLVLLLGHRHYSPALAERLEIAALISGLSVMCVLNFGQPRVSWIPGNGFLFLCAPFLAWAAIRFCPLEAAGAVVVMGGFAAWGSLHGWGPFGNPAGLPLFVGGFMAVGGAMTITVAAASAEQKSATKDALGMYCVLKDVKEGEIRVLQDTVEALQVELARNGTPRTTSSSQESVP